MEDHNDTADAGRIAKVRRAATEWTQQLLDLSGRNNLLHFRDLRRGTLDLTSAEPRVFSALLQGKSIRLSTLFPETEQREDALSRARALHKKAKENFEERGVETLTLAFGLVSWENKHGSWTPRAPILLRRAEMKVLGAAQDEFELQLVDEMEVNPTLLHVLRVDFDCRLDEENLLNRIDGVIDEPWELDEAYTWMRDDTGRIPEFSIEPRIVLANFAYAKLPMVKDLENAFDALVEHDLVAAIAGDEDAREVIRKSGAIVDAVPNIDFVPPEDEFLVLDADSSQSHAINAVVAGANLIVKGPPGTGKSQTISNLIATLVARGKKVLFVAEKRAAIDAVLKRLHQQKLGDLVLDMHGGVASRRSFAQTIEQALDAHRTAQKVDAEAKHELLSRRRDELNAYARALHRERDPWGVSVYDARAQLHALGPEAITDIRFSGRVLEQLTHETTKRLEEEIIEYARLGGAKLPSSDSPWKDATVDTSAEAQDLYALVQEIHRRHLPNALNAWGEASATLERTPQMLSEWEPYLDAWDDNGAVLERAKPAIFEQDLERLCETLEKSGASSFSHAVSLLFSFSYRRSLRQLRASLLDQNLQRDEALKVARDARAAKSRWKEIGGRGSPICPESLEELDEQFEQLKSQIQRISETVRHDLFLHEPTALAEQLQRLIEDRSTLIKLPRLRALESTFGGRGLGDLLARWIENGSDETLCLDNFKFARLQSILDHLAFTDSIVGSFVPEMHERAVEDFVQTDREHIEMSAGRIRRICAEQATRARDEMKEQAELVQRQANLKRRHMPVRDLVKNAAEMLLALKPCWAMSPLVVSQLLPPSQYFDVVIFDEASQITPPDAIPSIMRGRQLVVAGDPLQLPPTAFFASETPESETQEPEDPRQFLSGTQGFESILDALAALLQFRMLTWHYRSRDERLIAFSNKWIYGRSLTTFPASLADAVLDYVPVAWVPGADTNSPTPEVEEVVDLVLTHAQTRPHESLGVIAMGIKHANRIEEAVRQRLQDDRDLAAETAEFFDEAKEERFFVKNLERVQGDERDAIILSIGYGKNERGQMVYRFGPLLMEGGERRLNVAVTRAKKRLTLVASFSANDMDPERSNAEGVKLLRKYLQYVETGGESLGDDILDTPAMNAFELDVRDTLSARGLKLTPQYGSSGYRIDFAAQHPSRAGTYVLAIECDGATYHSSESARDRDRLRQQQLEQLGWRFHRIWSSEWFYDKEKAVNKAVAAYERAVSEWKPDSAERGTSRTATSTTDPSTDQTEAQGTAGRQGVRPQIRRGMAIGSYYKRELVELVRWIESDDQLRTEDEVIDLAIRELGFGRRGRQIVATLTDAIREARNQ